MSHLENKERMSEATRKPLPILKSSPTFIASDTPALFTHSHRDSPILMQGVLDFKTQFSHTTRFAVLCAPRTTDDISTIHNTLFGRNVNPNMAFMGNLAVSALNSSPVLILMTPSNINTSSDFPSCVSAAGSAHFIHFSTVQDYSDEHQLKSGCHFLLTTAYKNYRFRCATSIAYQVRIDLLIILIQRLGYVRLRMECVLVEV